MLLERLRIGARKQIGEADAIGREIADGALDLAALFAALRAHADDAVLVSHGTYALKDAASRNPALIDPIVAFLRADPGRFTQWEARENFLRVVLLKDDHGAATPDLRAMAAAMIDDPSAIVAAFAVEAAVRLAQTAAEADTVLDAAQASPRAAVRARARKLRTARVRQA